jgi:hypothetical protein
VLVDAKYVIAKSASLTNAFDAAEGKQFFTARAESLMTRLQYLDHLNNTLIGYELAEKVLWLADSWLLYTIGSAM